MSVLNAVTLRVAGESVMDVARTANTAFGETTTSSVEIFKRGLLSKSLEIRFSPPAEATDVYKGLQLISQRADGSDAAGIAQYLDNATGGAASAS